MRQPNVVPISVGPAPVHPLTLDELFLFLETTIHMGERAVIFNVNAHAINLAEDDEEFLEALRHASVVFCDGKAVQWAAKFLGSDIPERYTPPDWIERLCQLAVENSRTLFFLGGKPGIAEQAAAVMRKSNPAVTIGTHHGYFAKTGVENERVIAQINAETPAFLLVGFGMPTQERWIIDNFPQLSASVAFSVGGLFDFVSGSKTRGPRWLTDRGLEWLTRLVHEPGRLGRRYLLGNPKFLLTVLRQRLGE